MSSHKWPRTLARLISLFGVIVLVSLSSTSDWFVINGEGKYVEGIPREPAILINYTVNSTEEQVDLEFKNYTPLRTYWRNREPPVSQIQPTIKEYSSEDLENMDFKEEEEETILDLEMSREIMSYLFVTMIIIHLLMLLAPNLNLLIPLLVWFLGFIGFIIIVPMGVLNSFGFEGPTGGFSDETEESEFAHLNVDTSFDIDTEGIIFTIETLGFDLGLVPSDEQDNVSQNKPAEGEENYDSLIGFDAYLQLEFSDALSYWCYIPIIITLVYFVDRIDKKIYSKNNEEE
ncbi:MAG: hypothetical protein CMB56_003370 [Methanobacteriota archaeon]|nr:MAG: hypothetical protein CMB56_003370 [Euryarchaeota archaeon]|tara:strand:- start:30 stop:893 length:864 start_codon:yes stop_codon:yes gene_type:complete